MVRFPGNSRIAQLAFNLNEKLGKSSRLDIFTSAPTEGASNREKNRSNRGREGRGGGSEGGRDEGLEESHTRVLSDDEVELLFNPNPHCDGDMNSNLNHNLDPAAIYTNW